MGIGAVDFRDVGIITESGMGLTSDCSSENDGSNAERNVTVHSSVQYM